LRGIECLLRHSVEFNTLTVLNVATGAAPRDVYRHLVDVGSRWMQFIPAVERCSDSSHAGRSSMKGGAEVTPWSIRPEQWGEFLIGVFDEWRGRDVGRVFVQLFEALLAMRAGLPAGLCVLSKTCGKALAVERDGAVYSCDQFVDRSHRLGNLLHEELGDMVMSQRQRAFGEEKWRGLPSCCRRCEFLSRCYGECPRHRFLRSADGEPGLSCLCCEGHRALFADSEPHFETMWQLLRLGNSGEVVSIPMSNGDRGCLGRAERSKSKSSEKCDTGRHSPHRTTSSGEPGMRLSEPSWRGGSS